MRRVAPVLMIVYSLLSVPGANAAALQSPFVEVVHRNMAAGPATRLACDPAPPVQRDVLGVSYYTDPHHSIPDPKLQAQNVKQLTPVRDYLAGVVRYADAAASGDAGAAQCAFAWLDGWAAGAGMLGQVNHQGEYEREWTLGGLALEYLKLRDTGRLADPTRRAAIELWLAQLARAIEPYYAAEEAQNNHAYWGGLAVSACGIAAGDQALFDWGIAKYKLGVSEITAEGTLPREMRRGRRALHYHLFALTPLVMLAELGQANQIDMYGFANGALHRLVKRDVDGMRNPEWFAQRAGAAQDIAAGGPLRMDEIAWFEPYRARFHDVDFDDLLAKNRPIQHPWMGGNLTALYATKTFP